MNKFGYAYCVLMAAVTTFLAIGYHFFGYTPFPKDAFTDLYGLTVTITSLILVLMALFFSYQLKNQDR